MIAIVLALLLALAALTGIVRLVLWQRAAGTEASRPWRFWLLLALQPATAALLYLTLVPPALPGSAGELVVATRNAPAAAALAAGRRLVALPEAPPRAGTPRTPDLATALRDHPGARLRVIGDGLEPRDREAARGQPLAFDPPPLPRGLVRLDPPGPVAPGAAFAVTGAANGVAGGSAELVDPAGRRVDAAPLDADGSFTLRAAARAPGPSLFRLRLRDRQRGLVAETEVPVVALAAPPPRLLMLAAAPGPEVKYLRRWAEDAGLPLQARIGTGGGIALGDAPFALDAATLARADLLILDDRSWAVLGAGARGAILAAVRGGMGLLVRAPDPATRNPWRALGFATSGGSNSVPLRLAGAAPDDEALAARRGPGTRDAPAQVNAGETALPDLTRADLRFTGGALVPLIRDATGTPAAAWHAQGRGRIGLWPIADSFTLVLAGHGDVYGELWSTAVATLARADSRATATVSLAPRAGQRVALCGVGPAASVVAPNGGTTRLFTDGACAGYWPAASGWHLLRQPGGLQPFYVGAADANPGLRTADLREATLRLVSERKETSQPATERGPSWPWFIGWLALSATLWWFERARIGRAEGRPADDATGLS